MRVRANQTEFDFHFCSEGISLSQSKKEGAPNGAPFQSLRSQALSPRIGAKPKTPNPQRRALRALSRRGLGNLRHGRGESASISAVDRQAVLRRADHRLRGALVGDVAVVDRLEHVGVVFVS